MSLNCITDQKNPKKKCLCSFNLTAKKEFAESNTATIIKVNLQHSCEYSIAVLPVNPVLPAPSNEKELPIRQRNIKLKVVFFKYFFVNNFNS